MLVSIGEDFLKLEFCKDIDDKRKPSRKLYIIETYFSFVTGDTFDRRPQFPISRCLSVCATSESNVKSMIYWQLFILKYSKWCRPTEGKCKFTFRYERAYLKRRTMKIIIANYSQTFYGIFLLNNLKRHCDTVNHSFLSSKWFKKR